MSIRIHFLKEKQRLYTGVSYNLLVSEVKTFMQSFLATNEECVLTDGTKRLDDKVMIGSIQGKEPLYCITKQQYITFLEEMIASYRMCDATQNGILKEVEHASYFLREHIRKIFQDRDNDRDREPKIRQQENYFRQDNYQRQMLGGGEQPKDDLQTISMVQGLQLEQLRAFHNKLNHLLDFNHDSVILDVQQELKTQTELVQNLLNNNLQLVQELDKMTQIISELKERISIYSQSENQLLHDQIRSADTIKYLQGRIELLNQQIYTERLVKEVEQTDFWKEDLAERVVSFFKQVVPTLVGAKETLVAIEKLSEEAQFKPGELEQMLKQEKLRTKQLEEENADLRKIVETLRTSLVFLKMHWNVRNDVTYQDVYVGDQINHYRFVEEYRPPPITNSIQRACRAEQRVYELPERAQENRGHIDLNPDRGPPIYMRPVLNYKRI